MTRARLALALSVLPLLASCAATHWVYDKPGMTPAALDHDREECRKEAIRPSRVAIFRSQRSDQEALNRCMERKGYRPTLEEQ